jgi:nucleoside phosphorylase
MAMAHEAGPFITRCALKPMTSVTLPFPLQGFEGNISGAEISLVVNGAREVRELDGKIRVDPNGAPVRVEGVSVVPAAISAWESIKTLNPDIVINAGTAGGSYARGARRGQVYLCQSPMRYHDRHIDFRLPGDSYEPNNYWCFGIGSFAPSLLPEKVVNDLGLSSLIVSTGASFGPLTGLMAKTFEQSNAALIEMEAAAISEVCVLTKKPFVIIKGCTDYIDTPPNHDDKDNSAQFAENLVPVSESVAVAVEKLITLLRAG